MHKDCLKFPTRHRTSLKGLQGKIPGDAVEPYFVYKNLDDFAARCHYDMAITSLHVWVDGTWLSRFDRRDKKWMRFEIIILDPPEDEHGKKELK